MSRRKTTKKAGAEETPRMDSMARPPQPPIRYTPWEAGREKIRVLLLPETAYFWAQYFGGIYRALKAHPKTDPLVAFTPQRQAFGLHGFAHLRDLSPHDALREQFLKEGVPFINVSAYDLKRHRPHVALYNRPYVNMQMPAVFHLRNMAAHGVRLAGLLYGVSTLTNSTRDLRWEYQIELYHMYWRLFLISSAQRKAYGEFCSTGNAHTVITGHPKTDPFAVPPPPNPDILEKAKGRPAFLMNLNSHFLPQISPNSTLTTWGLEAVEALKKRDDLLLVFRPHPSLYHILNYIGWSWDQINEFKKELRDSPNTFLDESEDLLPSFRSVDALISDLSSLLVEFLPTEKPILYLKYPKSLPMQTTYRSYEAALYQAFGPEELHRFADMVIRREDPLSDRRMAHLEPLLNKMDGRAAERIAEAIVDGLAQGPGFVPHPRWMRPLGNQAEDYWLAPAASSRRKAPAFHEWKTNIIHQTISQYGPFRWIVDLGCGEGHYTELLATAAADLSQPVSGQRVKNVEAWDIVPQFIETAKEAARKKNITNIDYKVGSCLDITRWGEEIELVTCLELTSSLIDNDILARFLDWLKLLACPSPYYLLLGDTFARSGDLLRPTSAGFGELPETVFRCRGFDDFMEALERRGMVLIQRHDRPVTPDVFDALLLLKIEAYEKQRS